MLRDVRKRINRKGQTTIEYLLVVGLIAAAVIFAGYNLLSDSGKDGGALKTGFTNSMQKATDVVKNAKIGE